MSDDNKVPYSLFGFGINGVPSMLSRQLAEPGGGERLACLVIDGSKGKRVAPDYLRTVAQVLVEWYGRLDGPLPDFVIEANAAALSLISPDTGAPRPAPGVRRLMGYPVGVDLQLFLYAAGCDAAALALHFMPEDGDPPPVEALVQHVAGIQRATDWATPGASILGDDRAKLRLYRSKPEYGPIVAHVGGWLLVLGGMLLDHRPAGLSRKAIRDFVSELPLADVVTCVDMLMAYPHEPIEGVGGLLALGDAEHP